MIELKQIKNTISVLNNTGSTISAFTLINVYNNSGALECKVANADSTVGLTYVATHLLLEQVTTGHSGLCTNFMRLDSVSGISGLTVGSVYLGANGALSSTAFSEEGNINQKVGFVESSTEVVFNITFENSSATSDQLQFYVTQSSHGFSVLTPIYYDIDTNLWTKAKADSLDTLATHTVIAVESINRFKASQIGRITIPSHGKAEGFWFTSDTTAGTTVSDSPLISNPVFFVEDANTIEVLDYRPIDSSIPIDETVAYTDITNTFLQIQQYNAPKTFTSANQLVDKNYVDLLITSAIRLQGEWDASINSPNIIGTTTTGFAWRVSVSGSTSLGGITTWRVGDLAVKVDTGWMKIGSEDISAVWGNITGTLANQTDLFNAINAKSVTITAVNLIMNNTNKIVKVTAQGKIITLPTAVGITGYEFKIDNASTGDIIVSTTAFQTINGETSQIISKNSCINVYSDGSNWRIS